MPDKIKFGDVGSDYEPSESEGEYSEGEREILKNVRRRGRDQYAEAEQEEAILAFDEDEDDDDEEPDFDEIRKFEHDSDIEDGGDEDDLPDRHAWGSKASAFYGTGYTDRDYDTLTAQEEELAQLEEVEALEIQKRLIQGMTAEDFQLDLLVPTEDGKPTEDSEQPEEKAKKKKQKDRKTDGKGVDEIVIKGDLSDLSERQQRELFRKDAPEFEGLVNDFSTRMSACVEMEPVLELLKEQNKLQHPFGQLLTKRYELGLLYCNNINFYVLLKSRKVHIRNHPLVKRLLQLKRLVQEVEQKYEESIKPQADELLAALADGVEINFHDDDNRLARNGKGTEKKGRRLKVLERLEEGSQSDDDEDDGGFDEDSDAEESRAKRFKLDANESDSDDANEEQDEDGIERGADVEMEHEEDEDKKRKITYQMAKNKGLAARKRKDQHNVRVKNKQKYRKALIRRKGAIRPVRNELKRYAGETSIKAFVKRGIKIK
ncbi:something about silencing protein 10 [Anopheles ziemanni]|uniref:something about silencing protein 10 n=1 Tax=Anopheles coustani TaxID=139045 RepID=UPI002657BE97|nr:something about silencing protein 10 [Anopheles coustani]XP_058174070.1 something about silencing protein 10 [Anopheles ziemanni]